MSRIQSLFRLFGFDFSKTFQSVKAIPSFIRDYRDLKKQIQIGSEFPFGKSYPCLGDDKAESGTASGYYFYQDFLVAKRILQNNPRRHIDVGSRIDGFIAHVAVFRSIEVIDIRPLSTSIANIIFNQLDITLPLPNEFVGCCDSVSCLHTLEHFGLGRYGDPINYQGHLVGLDNLSKLLKPGGKFYLSVPIGPQRIEFNAHRVFSVQYLLSILTQNYQLDSFSYVDDAGNLHEDVELLPSEIANSYGCNWGCGILELTKL